MKAAGGGGAVRAAPAFMIVGTPRSGTTLVQRLACELPGVRVPPETHFLPLFLPGLVRRRRFPLGERALREELARYGALGTSRGLELDADAAVAALGARCASPLDLFGAIVATLAGPAGIHGEKTPNHLLWWRPLARALPALKLVAVVRDPRAVVASYRTTWGARDHRVLAERWRSDQGLVRAARRTLGGRLLVLRYEDVVEDLGAARRALAAHLGVDPPQGELQAPGRLGLPWETWKAGAGDPPIAGRHDAWRDALGEREAAEVLAIARDRLGAFGYARSPRLCSAGLSPKRRLRFRVRRRAKVARFRLIGRALR